LQVGGDVLLVNEVEQTRAVLPGLAGPRQRDARQDRPDDFVGDDRRQHDR